MEWLLDSANTKDWKRVSTTGLFSAVTTNPLLIQRAGLKCSIDTYKSLHDQAMDLGFDHLQLQVFGDDWQGMAEQILAISDKTIVKIPANEKGFSLATTLGVPERTTITGVYSVHLGAAAERLGAAYAAPYYARLAESNRDVETVFAGLRAACQNTKVLVASLRSIEQFEHLVGLGHRCFTIPGALLDDLMSDQMTEAAIAQFEEAAKG
jgi:transaldolase